MEETPVIPMEQPEAPRQDAHDAEMTVEERLSALSRQIMQQLENSAQAEQHRRTALDEREAALQRRELLSRAREEMEKRGLPIGLSECMAFADEAAMESGISLLEESFRNAVQNAVEARLLSSAPKTSAMRPLNELPDDEYYAAVCRTH